MFQLGTPAVYSYGIHSLQPSWWPRGWVVRQGRAAKSPAGYTHSIILYHKGGPRSESRVVCPEDQSSQVGQPSVLTRLAWKMATGQPITGVSTNSTVHSSRVPLLQGDDSSSSTVMLFGAEVVRMFLGTNKVICGPFVGQYRPRLKPLIHTWP